MRMDTTPELEQLAKIAESAKGIQRSSTGSLLMMIAGLVVVAASAWYSSSQLAPLEARIKEKRIQLDQQQREVEKAEAEVQKLAKEKAELYAAVQATQENLKSISQALPKVVSEDPATQNRLNTVRQDVRSAEQAVDIAAAAVTPMPEDLKAVLASTFGKSAAERIPAFDKLLAIVQAQPHLMAQVVDYAIANRENSNGVYNTFALANALPDEAFQGARSDIERLLQELKDPGPRTSKVASQIQERLRTGRIADDRKASVEAP